MYQHAADPATPAVSRAVAGSAASCAGHRARHRAAEAGAFEDQALRWAAEEAHLRRELADRRSAAIRRGVWCALVAVFVMDIVVAVVVIARV